MLSSLKQREADDEAKHSKSVEELSQLDQQIKMTRRNEDEVLKELENNVALKIGLRSVVRNMPTATDSPIGSIPLPCPLSGASKKAEPGVEAGGTLIDNPRIPVYTQSGKSARKNYQTDYWQQWQRPDSLPWIHHSAAALPIRCRSRYPANPLTMSQCQLIGPTPTPCWRRQIK